MSTRLPIDGGVLAYFGFDEANPGDPAVDESGNGNDLTVTGAAAVVPARLGNGRQFDGAVTVATPADSSIFRIGLNGVVAWFILDSVNQAGDGLRPILTLEGPGAGANDDTDLGLHVSNAGALVLHLTASGGLPCVLSTAPGSIRVNRYYSVAITIDIAPLDPPTSANGIIAKLWLNNVATPWTSFTVNGVPLADPNGEGPVRAPCGGNTFLTLGGRQKSTSKWHGVLDEVSLHSTVRAYDPYLRAAYFRLTLATSFTRLTTLGTVRVLAAADMGGGTRWWCYERDQSIFVIRENSLGLFGQEVQLTVGPNLANGAASPGGMGVPRLAYDAGTDTLVVAFLGAGRVFKVTALSSDQPANLIVPATGETLGGAIKVVDPVDRFRGSGGDIVPAVTGAASIMPANQALLPPTVAFIHVPFFGVAVSGTNPAGYALYRIAGGAVTLLATLTGAKQVARWEAQGNYWFVPITDRVDGAAYVAYARGGMVPLSVATSNRIVDRLGALLGGYDPADPPAPDALTWSRYGDATHEHFGASAGEANSLRETFRFNTTTPVKQRVVETFDGSAGDTPFVPALVINATTPVKAKLTEEIGLSCGDSTWLTMTLGNRRVAL